MQIAVGSSLLSFSNPAHRLPHKAIVTVLAEIIMQIIHTERIRTEVFFLLPVKIVILDTGPTGTGKSYLATALGNKACQDGFRVFYAGTNKLISLLKIAKVRGTLLSELKRIERADLLILDDFGMQTLDSQGRGIMMEIIEDRHDKHSTMITLEVPV